VSAETAAFHYDCVSIHSSNNISRLACVLIGLTKRRLGGLLNKLFCLMFLSFCQSSFNGLALHLAAAML
jgi:hypothetical protein